MATLLTMTDGRAQQARDGSTAAPAGTGVLTGVVTTAGDSPMPVPRVVMSLSGSALRTSVLAVTDREGRFFFRNLPPGRFTLDARKAGFVREVHGATTRGATEGVPIPVGDGTTEVMLSLVRSAAISGHVLMPSGAPVFSVRLQVLRWDVVRGRRQLVSARGGAFGVAGDGRYRIGGLPPGEYVVVAYPFGSVARQLFQGDGQGAVVSLAPVYSPGTADPAQARAVRLDAGDDRVADIAMDFVPTGRVEGRVFGLDGAPMAGAQVAVSAGLPAIPQGPSTRTSADGAFVLPPVVPGTYTVVARGAPAGMPPPPAGSPLASQPRLPLWAQTTLSVVPGGLLQGIDLHLQPGRAIRGRIVLPPGGATTVTVSGLYVMLAADDDSSLTMGMPVVQPSTDGTFEVPGVAPGRYRLQVTIPPVLQNAVFVTGMEADGRDVLDTPIAVTLDRDVEVTVSLSANPAVLDVSVHDRDGRLQSGQPVVVFPSNPSFRLVPSRRVVVTRTGADGLASIRGLPDGAYLVVALPVIPDAGELTTEWFAAMAASAVAVDVRDGRRTAVTITAGR